MFKRILVPLDGSDLSERVLPRAQQLAGSFGAVLELVYIVPSPIDEIPEDITSQAIQDGEKYLADTTSNLLAKSGSSKVDQHVESGHPASLIIERAESQSGTLILISSRAYSGLKKLLLGSVAGKVLQAANCPVLLVPADAKNPEGDLVEFKRAIVPLDGSELAERVLPIAVSMCKTLDMELILLRSYDPSFPGTSIRMHDVSQIVHDAAENYIKAKAEQLQQEGLSRVSYQVLRGVPADQITDFAVETPNSLTAMCTHGHHGIGRWLLGSVTEAVIHCAEEPVLVIRSTNG